MQQLQCTLNSTAASASAGRLDVCHLITFEYPSVQSANNPTIWISGSPPNLPQPNENSKLHAREIVNYVNFAKIAFLSDIPVQGGEDFALYIVSHF